MDCLPVTRGGMRKFWIFASVALTAQCAGLLIYSHALYAHFDLSEDFAHNAQAWFLIGHGDLSPLDTVRIPTTPFWRDHFDLILWPLSLLELAERSPFSLLVVQDLALVAAEVVTVFWIVSVCSEHLEQGWPRTGAVLAATALLMANPWWYEAASFDVHLPSLGLFLVVLTAYSLWRGRYRRAVTAAVLCVFFGTVVVELVVFVGLAALCSRRVRRAGGLRTTLTLATGAAIWVVAASAIGADQASNLSTQYSYLAGSASHAGVLLIVGGTAAHPSRLFGVLAARWHPIVREVLASGVVGVVTPWGALVSIGVLVPAVLAGSPTYIAADNGFQTLPVVPFIIVGSVMVLTRLGKRPAISRGIAPLAVDRTRIPVALIRRRRVIALALAIVLLTGGIIQSWRVERTIPKTWFQVSTPAAAALLRAERSTPSTAEVVASNGVMGRFADRRLIYPLERVPQRVPVLDKTVVFVIAPAQGIEALSASAAMADIRYLRQSLHARVLATRDGISVLEWHPPLLLTRITLP